MDLPVFGSNFISTCKVISANSSRVTHSFFFCLARFQILGPSKHHDKFARSSCVYQLTYIGQIHNKAVRYEEK